MGEIKACRVPPRTAAIWWLGQNGYIFKSPAGVTVALDLYLTNSCAALGGNSGLNLDRRVPVWIQPGELEVDVFACTHNHQDHTDPETIARLCRDRIGHFVGPQPSCEVFRRKGVSADRILPAWPDCRMQFGDVTLHGTFALPTDGSDLNHMGFALAFEGGPVIYNTGDTDYSELLESAAKFAPDMMIVCINAGFNNLSHFEAALLAARIKPKVAVPCHYDLFPDNAADPQQFRACLAARAPEVRYLQLEHAQAFLFNGC